MKGGGKMRLRTRPIRDVKLTEKDIRRIKKGYRIYKGHICLFMVGPDRKAQRQIERLKAKIKDLEAKKKGK